MTVTPKCNLRAKALTQRLLADARPTKANAFKVSLIERTLASVLAQARTST